jgi:hypothetical protein
MDDEIIERKEKTGKTHEDIYMRGLQVIEQEMSEQQQPSRKRAA